MDETALTRAYRDSTYWVDHPAGRFPMRIGEPCAPLQALLHAHGAITWAFVTACNPRSQLLPPAENAARHARLLSRLRQSAWPTFPGHSVSDQGEWLEHSLLILGIDDAAALALGAA